MCGFLLPFCSVHSFSAKDIAAAMKLAVDFTVASIKATVGGQRAQIRGQVREGIARAYAELGELTAAHRRFNSLIPFSD